MPAKTNSDLIQELLASAAEHRSELSQLNRRIETRADLLKEQIAQQAAKSADAQVQADEFVQTLLIDVRVLQERDAARQREFDAHKSATDRAARERATESEKLRDELTKTRDELAAVRQENAVLKQQLADHIKRVEVWDGRRWSLGVLIFSSVLTLVSGLVLHLTKK